MSNLSGILQKVITSAIQQALSGNSSPSSSSSSSPIQPKPSSMDAWNGAASSGNCNTGSSDSTRGLTDGSEDSSALTADADAGMDGDTEQMVGQILDALAQACPQLAPAIQQAEQALGINSAGSASSSSGTSSVATDGPSSLSDDDTSTSSSGGTSSVATKGRGGLSDDDTSCASGGSSSSGGTSSVSSGGSSSSGGTSSVSSGGSSSSGGTSSVSSSGGTSSVSSSGGTSSVSSSGGTSSVSSSGGTSSVSSSGGTSSASSSGGTAGGTTRGGQAPTAAGMGAQFVNNAGYSKAAADMKACGVDPMSEKGLKLLSLGAIEGDLSQKNDAKCIGPYNLNQSVFEAAGMATPTDSDPKIREKSMAAMSAAYDKVGERSLAQCIRAGGIGKQQGMDSYWQAYQGNFAAMQSYVQGGKNPYQDGYRPYLMSGVANQ